MNKIFDTNILKTVDNTIGIIGLVSIIVVTVGVFTRFVLQVSMAWSDEFLRTIFVWAYFIGTAMQFSKDGLMRLELFDETLQRKRKFKLRKIILRIQNMIILIFSAVVLNSTIKIILGQIINKQVTTTSGMPAWIIPLGFALGMVLLFIFSLVELIRIEKIRY